jgi:hypothetical protein
MSGLTVTTKEPMYPDYVEKVYALMTEEDKEAIVKTEIYACCKPSSQEVKDDFAKAVIEYPYLAENGWNHDYELDSFTGAMSNRVQHGPAQHIVDAMVLCMVLYYHETLPMGEVQDYTCPCCGYVFRSRHKEPQCIFCGKFAFEREG